MPFTQTTAAFRSEEAGKTFTELLLHGVVLLFLALIALLLIVPWFANLFAGVGVDLPVPASWVRAWPGLWISLFLFLPPLLLGFVAFVAWRLVRSLFHRQDH